jgi:hypothetical protein
VVLGYQRGYEEIQGGFGSYGKVRDGMAARDEQRELRSCSDELKVQCLSEWFRRKLEKQRGNERKLIDVDEDTC